MSLDRLDRVEELGEAPEVGLGLLRGRHGARLLVVFDPVRNFRFSPLNAFSNCGTFYSLHGRMHLHPALHYIHHFGRHNKALLNFGTCVSFVRSSTFVDGLRRVLSVCLSATLPPVASARFLQNRMHVLQEREPVDQGGHLPILFKMQKLDIF